MFKKIDNDIKDFVGTIKEPEGCDKMLDYMNSNHFASVKLIMFASSTFSICAKLMLFFLISSAGLLMSSSIGIIPVSSTLLLGTVLFLFILLLIFITNYKKNLISCIESAKSSMEKS